MKLKFFVVTILIFFIKFSNGHKISPSEQEIYENNLKIFNTTEFWDDMFIGSIPRKSNNDAIPAEEMKFFEQLLKKKYGDRKVKVVTAVSPNTHDGTVVRSLKDDEFSDKIIRQANDDDDSVDETNFNQCGIPNTGLFDRIAGGVNAKIFEYPWMIVIGYLKKPTDNIATLTFSATGSLIHPKIVLTAAYRIKNYVGYVGSKQLFARAGDYDISGTDEFIKHQIRLVDKIIMHENYTTPLTGHNIAMVVLSNDFDITVNVKTICLPPPTLSFIGKDCYIAGWGKDGPYSDSKRHTILQSAILKIIGNDECTERVKQIDKNLNLNLKENTLCAVGEGKRDACKNDGGAPLFCSIENSHVKQYYQVGIVSTGFNCTMSYPGFYTNIMYYRHWIDTNVRKLGLSTTPYIYSEDDYGKDYDDKPVVLEPAIEVLVA